MKRNTILAALTAVSLSVAVTPVGAQQLLPQPKQAVFGKGTFNPQKGVVLMEETSGAGHGKEYYRLHITPDTMRVAYADSTASSMPHRPSASSARETCCPSVISRTGRAMSGVAA